MSDTTEHTMPQRLKGVFITMDGEKIWYNNNTPVCSICYIIIKLRKNVERINNYINYCKQNPFNKGLMENMFDYQREKAELKLQLAIAANELGKLIDITELESIEGNLHDVFID